MHVPILVLAAGSSSRLGQPKQLVLVKGTTLLGKTISTCVDSKVGPVYTVLGSNMDDITPLISSLNTGIVINSDFRLGIGATIAVGVKHLIGHKEYTSVGVIIVLADQLHLTATVLQSIAKKMRSSPTAIIMSRYTAGYGPPTFFPADLLSSLIQLRDDHGAKSIIETNQNRVQYIDFANGHIDIDVPEDLDRLL